MPKDKKFPPIRMTQDLLDAIKTRAAELNLPQAQFVRMLLERAARAPVAVVLHFLYGEKMDQDKETEQ